MPPKRERFGQDAGCGTPKSGPVAGYASSEAAESGRPWGIVDIHPNKSEFLSDGKKEVRQLRHEARTVSSDQTRLEGRARIEGAGPLGKITGERRSLREEAGRLSRNPLIEGTRRRTDGD